MCPVDYRKYPFDGQTCRIDLTSNELPNDQLSLRWIDDNPFIIDDSLYISSHSLDSHQIKTDTDIVDNQGYDRVLVQLNLKRKWVHYLFVLFLPSMLIVFTSWLSFWIEISSSPSRVTICVTTLLAMVTVGKESYKDLPKVPYIKAVDLWFALCIGRLSNICPFM